MDRSDESKRVIREGAGEWEGNIVLLALSNGLLDFAKESIRVNRELASERINQDGYSVMHSICEFSDAVTVKTLVEVDPDYLCLLRDNRGRTLLHIAAEKGKEEVLRALITLCPQSILEVTSLEETALHLALKNDHIGCFLVLMENLHQLNSDDILNRGDHEGNTLLHIATSRNQMQIVNMLLSYKSRSGDYVVNVNNRRRSWTDLVGLHQQKVFVSNETSLSDILHQMLQSSYEGGQPSYSQLNRIVEKMKHESLGLMVKSVLLAVFIFIANAAYDGLFNLTNIYKNVHVEITVINAIDVITSPNLLPNIFFAIVFNTITFLGSMVVIFVNTWSMASNWSLCHRAIPVTVTCAMMANYGIVVKEITPKFWVTIGSGHKLSSFWVVWLYDLALVFSTVTACLLVKQIFCIFTKPSC